jgi:hypothetical protein
MSTKPVRINDATSKAVIAKGDMKLEAGGTAFGIEFSGGRSLDALRGVGGSGGLHDSTI